VLDRLKFTRISMLTDPALDAGRHAIYKEVKAVTYHKFSIQQEGCHLKATVFLDI
jgi:SHS2 domain-containing protein